MKKRLYSARRMTVTEKSGQLSGFSSVQPCISLSEQNETDEPPSLFNPLNAGAGLQRQPRINTHPFIFSNSGTLLPSKTDMMKVWNFLFADTADKERMEQVPCGLTRLPHTADSGEMMQREGFILRDKNGRIRTVIFCKKRSR